MHFRFDRKSADIYFRIRCFQKNIISFFRFQDSGDSIGKLVPENKDKEILVPLTGSMYVPGKLSDPEKVIVDVGTGYVI